jgi:hypothetical protein
MKIRNTVLALAGAVLLGGTLFTGCTTEDTTSPGTTTYTVMSQTVNGLSANQLYLFTVTGAKSPVVLGAAAADDKSVTIWWKHDASDATTDAVTSAPVSTASNSSNTITWATAYKTGPINIYETSDPSAGHPSGLIISGNATQSSPLTTANKPNIDLVLLTDSTVAGSMMSLVSSNLAYTGGRNTFFGLSSYRVHGGASNLYFTGDITSLVPVTGSITNFYDIPNVVVGDSSTVLLLNGLSHTTTGATNFARVEIVPDGTTHQLYTVAGGHKYITVNVWSQSTVGWGYVGRPAANRTGNTTLAPKGQPVNIIRQ